MLPLVPYEPFRRLDSMRRDLDQMFEQGLGRFGMNGSPRIDVYETDSEVIAESDLPGLQSEDDLNIKVNENQLTISGVVRRAREIEEDHVHRQERFQGRFQRTVPLPSEVNPKDVEAHYEHGVLKIHMPKQHDSRGRRVNVSWKN